MNRLGLLFSALTAILLIGCSEPESSAPPSSPDSGAPLSVDTPSTDRPSPPGPPPGDSSPSAPQSPPPPSPTAIGLLRGGTTPLLFPLAKHVDGTFHEEDAKTGLDSIVPNQYRVFVSDTTQPTFTVHTADTAQMACTDVPILRGHLESTQLEYTEPHVAISAPVDPPSRPRLPDIDTTLTAAQRTTILDRAAELLPPLREPDTIRQDGKIMEVQYKPDDSLHIDQAAVLDFEGDGTTEYLAFARQSVNHMAGTIYDSAVLMGRISGSRWEELFVRVDTAGLSSPGYRLVEVIDVNGNDRYDLLLERRGYEGHAYVLFAYREEGFARVADVGYGC